MVAGPYRMLTGIWSSLVCYRGRISECRLFTDHLFQDSAALILQWLMRTSTNMEDMWMVFPEKDRTTLIVEEGEMRQAVMEDDEQF